MVTSNEAEAVLLWTERNRRSQALKKRENRAAAKAFLLAVIAITLAVALGTYLAGLRLRGVI